jgi:DNA-directed RNA polymerase subunit F
MTYTTSQLGRISRIDRMLRKAGIFTQSILLNMTEAQLKARIPDIQPIHIQTIKSILEKQGLSLKSEVVADAQTIPV